MGLIKAATGAAGGTLADQWKEFFYSDSLDNDTLMVRGKKRTDRRSSNTKGHDNVITNGIWNCRGGRAVYDDRGSGEDCGSMCGTGRIHI